MSHSILLVNSSPLGEHSISRQLSAKLIAEIKVNDSDIHIVDRDLVASAVPHLSGMTIGAFYQPDQLDDTVRSEALALSDTLIKELVDANVIVIAAPMWNFSIPSSLKAWIDQVIRPEVTFRYGANGPEGLLPAGKKVILISTRGGIYTAGPSQEMDYQETYMQSVLGFIGLNDVSIIRAEGVGMGEEAVKEAMQAADVQIATAVAHIA